MRLVDLFCLTEAREMKRVSWKDAERWYPESTVALDRDGVQATELIVQNGMLYARTRGKGWYVWVEPSTSDHPGDHDEGRWAPASGNRAADGPDEPDPMGRLRRKGKPVNRAGTRDMAVGNPGNEILGFEEAATVFLAEAERLGVIIAAGSSTVQNCIINGIAYATNDENPYNGASRVWLVRNSDFSIEGETVLESNMPPNPAFSNAPPGGPGINWIRSIAVATGPNIKSMLRQLKKAGGA